MDHKEFFKKWGDSLLAHTYWVTNEELYQFFKARLIVELRAEPGNRLYHETGYIEEEHGHLIDTKPTEKADEA